MIDVEKLNALIDNELDSTERAEVEAALAREPNATQRLDSIRLVKDALRDHMKPVPCADEWRTCVKRLNDIDRASKTKLVVDRWAWAMCSCLFAFILVVGMYNRVNPKEHVGTGELTRASMGNPIHDAAHVLQWVKDRFGASPSIPQEQLKVVSGEQGTVNDHPVARINLQDSKGNLNLMVVGGSVYVEGVAPMDDGVHYAGKIGDATTVAWSEDGTTTNGSPYSMTLVLVGNRDAGELRDIANTIHIGQQ